MHRECQPQRDHQPSAHESLSRQPPPGPDADRSSTEQWAQIQQNTHRALLRRDRQVYVVGHMVLLREETGDFFLELTVDEVEVPVSPSFERSLLEHPHRGNRNREPAERRLC